MALRHNCWAVAIIVVTCLIHMTTVTMYFISRYGHVRDDKNETISMVNMRHKHTGNFEHPEWLLGLMWPLLYIWQTLWLIYGLFTICRTTPNKSSYLYNDPRYISILTYFLYAVGMAFKLAWSIIMWHLPPAVYFGLLFTSAICIWIATAFAHRRLYIGGSTLLKAGMTREVWWVRILVHNGLAAMVMWDNIEASMGLSNMLLSSHGISPRYAGVTILAVIASVFGVFAVLDLLCFDKYMRYTLTPYLVVILSMAAGTERNWYSGATSVIPLIIIGVVVFCISLKFIRICGNWANKREPIYLSQRFISQTFIKVNPTVIMVPARGSR